MTTTAKEFLEATLKLDTKERARIAHEIIVSLDEEQDRASAQGR